jgi:iron complex outermembrane receptor protein
VSLNVRGEKNSLGEINPEVSEYGSRLSAFYIDQFMEGRLGIALGYARLDSPGERESWESWGYPTDIAGVPNGTYTIGGEKIQAYSTDNVRQGTVGVVEFKPNDFYHTTLDVYYSKFEKAEYGRFLETGLGWGGGVSLVNPIVENGVLVQGDFNNVRPVLRQRPERGRRQAVRDRLAQRVHVQRRMGRRPRLQPSKADRQESILESYSGTRPGDLDNVRVIVDPMVRRTRPSASTTPTRRAS